MFATCVRWELHGLDFNMGFEMAEDTKIEQTTRRSAIKTAAQVAVTAPAVGLLLSASSQSAMAQALPYGLQAGDDSSFTDNPLQGNGDQFTVNGQADDFHQGDDSAPGGTA